MFDYYVSFAALSLSPKIAFEEFSDKTTGFISDFSAKTSVGFSVIFCSMLSANMGFISAGFSANSTGFTSITGFSTKTSGFYSTTGFSAKAGYTSTCGFSTKTTYFSSIGFSANTAG